MKSNDIKVGHIYFVDYEPARLGEFGRKHLCIVLKKNNNEITFVTIPLTSDSVGKNKINLGIIESLPQNLRTHDSYAVIDQVRTVHASRFCPLLEDNKIKDAEVSNEILEDIFEAIIKDMTRDLPNSKHLFERLTK